VNIVDFIDEDDISTPFNFYTQADAQDPTFDIGALTVTDAVFKGELNLPKYWVFGTELPHVELNEVLAEYQDPAAFVVNGKVSNNVWVELFNTFQQAPAGTQAQDPLPVLLNRLALPAGTSLVKNDNAYAPYRLIIADTMRPSPLNDNVLGLPFQVRAMTNDLDFAVAPKQVGPPANPQAAI